MTAIGIIGYGHVGSTMAKLFPDAVIYDPNLPEHSNTRDAANRTSVAFVCVPTPLGEGGAADLSAVEDVVTWLDAQLIVLKSTVPPGTTSRLRRESGKRVVFCPEYIGESGYQQHWLEAPRNWPFVIVGGEPIDSRVLVDLLSPILGPQTTYRQTTAEQAELAKYMENAWLASQVAFAWQFEFLAQAFGADYREVRELWALDPRVSKWHTAVFSDKPGFTGKCLPKDIAAIAAAGQAAGADVSWLNALQRFNFDVQARQRPDH